jgi:hypothetical protein
MIVDEDWALLEGLEGLLVEEGVLLDEVQVLDEDRDGCDLVKSWQRKRKMLRLERSNLT